jgi:archaellum biogenesis ATPase FlaH
LKVIDKKLSEDPNKSTIRCHIKEIDQTLGVGFAPGTLVLFTADVGGGKSTIMLNIAFNIWEKEGKNVLFAPLEMPREKMYQKFLSRLLRIPFSKIEHPHLLNKVELEAIRNSPAKIEQIEKEKGGKFYIIDAPEQISVPALKKVIEKHISLFQPHLVVVDYIANLITDKDSYRKDMRNDLEIGNMLKSLRSMGRPNAVTKEGFCVVSGAQIGRDALKRIRQAGGKASFNSEDIRGSHEYSADSDAIYAQMPDPQQPDQKIFIHVIKSRYGKKSFENGAQRAVLNVNHEICLIQSASEMFSTFAPSGDDILKSLNAVNNLELDEETREPDPLEEILNA